MKNGQALNKNRALYSNCAYEVSFSKLFSVKNKDSNSIFRSCNVFTYVCVKLPCLTLFRLALELIGTYPPR